MRTQKDLDRLIKKGEPVAGVSFGDGLTFTSSMAQVTSGGGTWTFRYRHVGRQRERTLGNYPDMPLERSKGLPPEIKSAREVARAMRVMVDLGKDVAGEKRRAKAEAAAARTFREVAEDYLAGKRTIAEESRRDWYRYLNKDIYPDLGNIAIRDVTLDEVRVLVKRIAKRSQSVARRAFEMISVIFGHAIGDGAATTNPCVSLKVSSLVGERKPRRQRIALERGELVVLMASASSLGRINELMLKILLATCVRKGELVRARKADVNLNAGIWNVPHEHSKTRKGYTIPLAPVVAEWFRELLTYSGNSEWVLPARTGRARFQKKHTHVRTINKVLERSNLGVRAFTPHDLRATARSHLEALGVDPIVAERCLNHLVGGLIGVYNKHDYLAERREALAKWANLLSELEGKPDNVVPLRAAA